MNRKNQTAVIVDAYASGSLLAPELNARGTRCVHVQSTYDIDPIYVPSFRPGDFVANVRHRGDVEDTLRQLVPFEPSCVLVGTECGVELADLLGHRLGVKHNDIERSQARRNKAKMHQALGAAGLRHLRHLATSSLDEILQWYAALGAPSIVLKPVNSAGNDTICVCNGAPDIAAAFAKIQGATNRLGFVNRVVLAQERIVGTNYVVDTVTLEGTHHVTNIWKITKGFHNGAHYVYESNELLPFEGSAQAALVPYVLAALDALGISHGPAHSEVMLDEKGPILIETGARVHGAGFPIYNRECIGYCQVDLTADVHVAPSEFFRKSRQPYSLARQLVILELISKVDGVVASWPRQDEVLALPSFHAMKLSVAPGARIHKTIDLFTGPGYVALIHPDPQVVWRDYERIRALEAEDFYHVV